MPWSLTSGRKTDYTGTITGARFETTTFDNGNVQQSIRLTFTLDDGEEWHENYSLGGKWFPSSDGTMAEHEDGLTDAGEPRSFNKRSKYGAFIDSVMGLVPVDELRKRGDPVEARTWLGLRFKMGEKVLAGQKNPTTGDPVTMNVPVEYLGTEKTADETLADVHEQLQALAWECDDHNDFVEKAFALPGVEGNNHLVMAIADPDGLYQELRNDREATSSR